MKESYCPECDYRLKLGGHPYKGQRCTCPECETKLIVVSLHPLQLEAAASANQAVSPKHTAHSIEYPCPVCEQPLKLTSQPQPGQTLLCQSCYYPLKIMRTDPLEIELDLGPTVKENRSDQSEPEKSQRKKSHRDR